MARLLSLFNHLQSRARSALLAPRLEVIGYLLFAGICTLLAARSFFDARSIHLGWANAARVASDSDALRSLPVMDWSAPLDDTFIHFDFARSFANGHPFEWTAKGGYSSGGTSWLYPVVLAVGILLGFKDQALGSFADWLACVSVFAFLWSSRALFRTLPPLASYLLPPIILSSGVLGWSLWSGMELSLFLALWGACAQAFTRLRCACNESEYLDARRTLSWCGLLLVLARPEALYCVGLFSLLGRLLRRHPHSQPFLQEVLLVLAPALGFTLLRALINLVLTGSFADAGALVKLETLHPFHDSREMALRWLSHIGFQLSRITVYHTSSEPFWGFQLWLLALLGLYPKRTRSTVALLWLSALGWILIVAQNEYVRYQNDRYTMPAVSFLLIAAALGIGGTLSNFWSQLRKSRDVTGLPLALGIGALTLHFVAEQIPRLEQQRWLFGRACRNIAEQQIRVGQLLASGHFGPTQRVLVGDAGAIPYYSKLPAVDAIGLGGTQGLPFARATRLGVGATVELLERIEPAERPDKLAIYPSWWDLLPVWFGIAQEEIRIKGNVICGAANKGVYVADWSSLDPSENPTARDPGRVVIDELDFADVLSESAHGYHLSEKHAGYVVMKVLPHPSDPRRDLFDAGRLTFATTTTRFRLSGFRPNHPVDLFFRAAPTDVTHFRVRINGKDTGQILLTGGDGWQEPKLRIPAASVRRTMHVELVPTGTEAILYHLWATSPSPPR